VLIQEPISGEWKSFPLHNFWLELLVEGGLFAGGVFIMWYLWLIWTLYRNAFRASESAVRRISASTATALVAFIPASVSPSSVIYFLPMWVVLGLAVAALNAASADVAN
jgi:teichuronic acid biosynthesis protein TuaE